jgi:predicted 2-oxoglutarate/Fe(II)-dependent dioxygenase YbiX
MLLRRLAATAEGVNVSDIVALRLQADSGDAAAQAAMARILLAGRLASRAPGDAFRYLDAACGQNNADALLLSAAVAAIGLFRPQDINAAFAFVKRAALAGDARAEGQLRVLASTQGALNLDPWLAPVEATQHFDAPRIFTLKNFLPKPACDWLIAQSTGRLKRAPIVSTQSSGLKVEAARSNSGAPFSTLQPDLVVQLVNLRIAAATGAPLLNQEPSNVLHYAVGEEYVPHYDFFSGAEVQAHAQELAVMGQRVATLLVYLNDDYDGGETAFPLLDWRFRGAPGDALLFWSVTENIRPERNALHAGLPVTRGEKWLLSKWIRERAVPLT